MEYCTTNATQKWGLWFLKTSDVPGACSWSSLYFSTLGNQVHSAPGEETVELMSIIIIIIIINKKKKKTDLRPLHTKPSTPRAEDPTCYKRESLVSWAAESLNPHFWWIWDSCGTDSGLQEKTSSDSNTSCIGSLCVSSGYNAASLPSSINWLPICI